LRGEYVTKKEKVYYENPGNVSRVSLRFSGAAGEKIKQGCGLLRPAGAVPGGMLSVCRPPVEKSGPREQGGKFFAKTDKTVDKHKTETLVSEI